MLLNTIFIQQMSWENSSSYKGPLHAARIREAHQTRMRCVFIFALRSRTAVSIPQSLLVHSSTKTYVIFSPSYSSLLTHSCISVRRPSLSSCTWPLTHRHAFPRWAHVWALPAELRIVGQRQSWAWGHWDGAGGHSWSAALFNSQSNCANAPFQRSEMLLNVNEEFRGAATKASYITPQMLHKHSGGNRLATH